MSRDLPSVSVILELENATSLKDKEDLTASVQSVLESLDILCNQARITGEVVFSGQKEQCDGLVKQLESFDLRFPSIELKVFDNSGFGYFGEV
jgi:flagellin-like hook-associated protein FlgL